MEKKQLIEELRKVSPDTCNESCDDDIYKNGRSVIVIAGPRATLIEHWVKAVSKDCGEPVDWHWFGGRANVLTTGCMEKVRESIEKLLGALNTVYVERSKLASKYEWTLQTTWNTKDFI